jgi:hypothetical protein
MHKSTSHTHNVQGCCDDIDIDYIMMIVIIIVTNLSNKQEYTCEFCGRVYKQETRYKTHIREHTTPNTMQSSYITNEIPIDSIVDCGDVVRRKEEKPNNDIIIMELLKQNRDMMDMLKQQQETISLLLRHNKLLA